MKTWCVDDRHGIPCPSPCDVCDDCDPTATVEAETLEGAMRMAGWSEDYILTQLPTLGLDDLTADDVEREIRGAIYKTQRLVERAVSDEARADAQRALDALMRYAQKEGVAAVGRGSERQGAK